MSEILLRNFNHIESLTEKYFAGRVISQSSPYIFWIYTAKRISQHFSAQKVGINYQTVFSFSVLPNDAQESNVPFFENF